jgi:hypothetical protein
MTSNIRRILAVSAISLGLLTPARLAFAQTTGFSTLTAEWWQWALSIPTSINPLKDISGKNCMVGQHGSLWFLAGFWGADNTTGSITRNCTLPEGVTLFFPVANSLFVNTPGICQNGSYTASRERQVVAQNIAAAGDMSATIDGMPLTTQHLKSVVFAAAMPEDNLFDFPQACPNVPAAIFSPSVDDGYYVGLQPLGRGNHILHFKATGFFQDITYNLTVVRVTLQ